MAKSLVYNNTNELPNFYNNTVKYETSLAIDFGTTNCAIAYSYVYEQDVIHCVKTWPDGTREGKVPTAILFDKNGKFIDFGNGAITKYQELVLEEEHEEYYFFRNFKMELYNKKKVTKETMVTDALGKKMMAINVFTAAIKYLKSHLIATMNKINSQKPVDESTIRWVLTVPAIWSDASKQFMREAAEKAGCNERHLLIALEPEAASIYCRTASEQKIKSYNYFATKEAKYLLLDNGGGTLDVTAHQLIKDNCIKEIYRATGGAWGGGKVDEFFEEFLESLFSKENIKEIKKNHANEWIHVMQEFQHVKRKLNPDNNDEILSIKSSPICPWNRPFFNGIPANIKKGVELKKSGRLDFPRKVLFDMVKQVSAHIKEHTKSLLEEEQLKNLDYIMMVGGFSNSYVVVDDIKELVNDNIPIIVPEEVELCVVKGAVLFGWKPDIVRVRKSRKTYGFGVFDNFKEGVHDEKRAVHDNNGRKRCRNCFEKMITINDDVEINKQINHTGSHGYGDHRETSIQLYSTEKENPMYYDEEGVFLVGKIKIPRPKHARGKRIGKELYFGDTEIHLKVTDKTTKETYEKRFSCSKRSANFE